MTPIIESWRAIGWNGVQLACPRNWEAIISGKTHLLFEDNFQPILELRWQRQKKSAKQSAATITRKLQRESGLLPKKDLPGDWKELRSTYMVELMIEQKDDEQPKAALLTCRKCATTFLISFFQQLPIAHPDLTRLLASLECHGRQENNRFWSIQDFQVQLPESFQLGSYSFAAGLTRLSYIDSGLSLHLCRLTSAAQRLQKATLSELLMVLGDVTVPVEEVHQNTHSVSHGNKPSIFRQIGSRCRRKKPFHWMCLRHHPEYDRLSGLFFFDKKPIPEGMTSSILNSYELFGL